MESEQSDAKPDGIAETTTTEPAVALPTGNNGNNNSPQKVVPVAMDTQQQQSTSPVPPSNNPMTPLATSVQNGSASSQIEALDSASSSSSPAAAASPFVARMLGQNEAGNVDRGHPERKRRASNDSMDSSLTKVSEGNNDENDDDDNDEDEDKVSPGENVDPERLKAFNMFVRLFVDENLDRMIPISKQPKEKVQAILEACDRQFLEFRERSRKRIRTYLKSCRRLKKKDANGQEITIKQTPPHLTSAAAENILAQACENESHNAKRMRMGLEPLPANMMLNNTTSQTTVEATPTPPSGTTGQKLATELQREQHIQSPAPPREISTHNRVTTPRHRASPLTSSAAEKKHAVATDYSQSAKTPTMFRTPLEMSSHFLTANGGGLGGMFRPGFPSAAYTPSAHPTLLQSSLQSSSILSSQLQNGPTDLSMKNKVNSTPSATTPGGSSGASTSHPLSRHMHPLSASEVTTIKSLIAGYRESAAFLYRSADELEQLLTQQQH